tara:strand:- start:1025 stop:1771 length:747 start_codon:yes stop_codon:yes gene_type:complete
MSKEKEISFRDQSNQKTGRKPKGLWYGIGASWIDWVRGEMPEWEEDYTHLIDVDPNKIKVIKNYDELIEFNKQYSEGDNINWGEVARTYDGIEIVPHIGKARFELDWYGTWDIASGCIWGGNAIKGVNNLNDKQKDYKKVYRGQPKEYDAISPLGSFRVTFDYYYSKEHGDDTEYKLPKSLKIIDVGDYSTWRPLLDEFTDIDNDDDYWEYMDRFIPNEEIILFLKSKGYEGLKDDTEVLVFDKKNII